MRACTSFVWSNPNTPGKVKLTDAAAGLRTYVRAGFGGRDQNTYRTGSQGKNMEPAVVVFFGWSPSCRPAGQICVSTSILRAPLRASTGCETYMMNKCIARAL